MDTKRLFGIRNPWEDVAELYKADNDNCLYGDNHYICHGDEKAIENYNSKAKGTSDEITTMIPAEPWWGNPLTARLIIFSLNPGYVPEVNMKLAKLMQNNDVVREQVINYKRKTLLLEADSFMPEATDNIFGSPITCKDAVNMLGDWYWHKMLKHLKKDAKIDDEPFFRQIALVEYHGYSSQTSNRVFPYKGDSLKSQEFLKEMIWYIANKNTVKKDVRFLIMRSKDKWEKLLTKVFFDEFHDLIIEKKASSMISQYITEANFDGNKYKEIVDFLTHGKEK